ncbi:hypothetical protein J14TS2_15770 [Bacillus sp. J14TS2]|uniref:hypothetical protein n=1 Tax=Bacillus sp. J14TS2 TaxID=2807188 RepID=UPI001B049FE7|nr:hypothetical protein [Bacillus sp. J14TS2]GIN71102.1 hypothetical protein J14TS2_15770 [Bacillus sp. J14TS2]
MEEYTYTKILGAIVGMMTILIAVGFSILSFIGMGLSKAFNTGNDYSPSLIIFVFLLLFILGIVTGYGPFRLNHKAWYYIYIGLCLALGIGCVLAFIISLGSLGVKNELSILCIGMIYILLGFLVKRKK